MSEQLSCKPTVELIKKKQEKLLKENDGIDQFKKQANQPKVVNSVISQAVAQATEKLKSSPLNQLGQDFLSEQISKNGQQIMNNVTKQVESDLNRILGVPIRQTIADAQQAVFNTISAALTAKNDLSMFFLQNLAKECIKALDKKIEIARIVEEKLRYLYNALIILVSGDPYFATYLNKIRTALQYIDEAEKKFVLVRDTFKAKDFYLKTQFQSAVESLNAAEELLEPPKQEPDIKFNNTSLLNNVGIPSQPQQLTVVLSIPQLSKDVLYAAQGYFTANLKANALLLAFRDGLINFQNSSSQKLKEYTIGLLDQLISKTDNLADAMASAVNGVAGLDNLPQRDGPVSGVVANFNETSVLISTSQGSKVAPRTQYNVLPQTGKLIKYQPDSVKTSAKALGWILELKAIIEFASFIPGPTLEGLKISNTAVTKYNSAVDCIKTKNGITRGDAVLTATEGRESTGEFETQLSTFILKALQAIVDAKVADSVLALGRTNITRMNLSVEFNTDVKNCLVPFANADLAFPAALKKAGDSIGKLLDDFGLDRAKDLLVGGDYTSFFNLNSKTATYVGAALVGLAALKQCAGTTEDQELLTQAEREFQKEQKAKDLLSQRSAVTGFEGQQARNTVEGIRIQKISERACDAGDKCGVPPDLRPTNIIRNIGSVLGISMVGDGSVSKNLERLGKGFF
jgi:hypothetical protein